MFLSAAYKLHNGVPEDATIETTGQDTIKAMPISMWLDFISIRVNSAKAAEMEFIISLDIADRDEKLMVEMSNATLTQILGHTTDKADLGVSINRADLEKGS